jgi:DNA-binding NarL/FixJ family response regulator
VETNRISQAPSPPKKTSPAAPVDRAAIRVVVFCGVLLYREGLADLLASAGFGVTGVAADLTTATALVDAITPDIVLVDVTSSPGADAVRGVHQHEPGVDVIAFGVEDSDDHIVAQAEAGARGYVTRDASLEHLVSELECVARGETLCSPQVAAALMRRVASLATTQRAPGEPLTVRELEIANLLEIGCSNKEIARQLVIEVATVKTHVHNILEKLDVRSRTDVAVWVRERRGAVDATGRAHGHERIPTGGGGR